MKLKFITFLIALIAMYAIQREIITPWLVSTASSELFLDETKKRGNLEAISNDMTNYAHMHCNKYINSEYGEDLTLNFALNPINAWNIGADSYVINAEVDVLQKSGESSIVKYVCRIKYDEGERANYENWDIQGLSGFDDF